MKIGIIAEVEFLRSFDKEGVNVECISFNDTNLANREFAYDLLFVKLSGTAFENESLLSSLKKIKSQCVVVNATLPPGTISTLSSKWKTKVCAIVSQEQIEDINNSLLSYRLLVEDGLLTVQGLSSLLSRLYPHCDLFERPLYELELLPFISAYFKIYSANLTDEVEYISRSLGNKYTFINKVIDTSTFGQLQERTQLGLKDQLATSNLQVLADFIFSNGRQVYAIEGLLRSNTFNCRIDTISNDNNTDVIQFYEVDQAYGFFSNFSDHPIFCEGAIWRTVEHFYQAQKFKGSVLEDEIRNAFSPIRTKAIAHKNSEKANPDWEFIKIEVMYKGLYAKFTQHKELRDALIETYPRDIAEHSISDLFWGDGVDGNGKNMLGRLLMEVRLKLMKEA